MWRVVCQSTCCGMMLVKSGHDVDGSDSSVVWWLVCQSACCGMMVVAWVGDCRNFMEFP